MRTAIRKHLRDFAFVIGIVLVGLVVGSYILSNQRFYVPKWGACLHCTPSTRGPLCEEKCRRLR